MEGVLHFFDDYTFYLFFLFWIDAEVEFVVYLQDHLRTDALLAETVVDANHGHFDDVCRSHLETAVPVLKRYGFGATFFVSQPAEWFQEITDAHLRPAEWSELFKYGFELGNHTMDHPNLRRLEEDECRQEITAMNDLMKAYGIPSPVSFAYPGGPYAANAASFLSDYGIRFARTTELALWTKETDLMRIPCFAVCDRQEELFTAGLELLGDREDAALVLLYHGVPDILHHHCSTTEKLFKTHMRYLADNNFRVMSMAEYGIGITCGAG